MDDMKKLKEPSRKLQFLLRSLFVTVVYAALYSALAIADHQDSRWFTLQHPRPFHAIWLVVSIGTIAYLLRAKRLGILAPTVLFLAASLVTLLVHFL
jgi:hypothetical protein